MVISYILLFCLISQNVFGEDLHNRQNLQSILKEIDYLKERTLALEKQNKQLNEKIEKLENCCAEKTKEDDVRTANSGTLVNTTNTQNFALKSSSESTKEFSHRQTLTISKTSHLGQRTLGRRSPQSHVAFTAGVSSQNLNNLGDHQTIIFDNVITNIGNAYHPHTGIFTVPVKGAYVITLTMTVEPDQVQWLDLVVDGFVINFISAGQGSIHNYASTTKQWILDLVTGSEVWVWKTADLSEHRDLHGHMNTIISCFLLFQT
ncbi:complement C1q tumor necrosis factor-related protein 3-like [Ruditapes philippinarum]|uniref:complement C1q tumor necrosis factor-related protein 3-like n=1 Tax=Ruditapes philippinarum TaxID=129788 RepID=UPI00295B0FFB|nr:complement C1q tumor necrosis factor-related protein 3-like [Ruditapes philippinarum]